MKISLKPFEAKSPTGKKNKKAKEDLARAIHSEIVDGFIQNRDQLIGYLTKHNVEVPRVSEDFITVVLPGSTKRTRLRGPLFTKGSDYSLLVRQHHESKQPLFLTPDEAEKIRMKLAEGIAARAAFNQKRYRHRKGPAHGHKPMDMAAEVAPVKTERAEPHSAPALPQPLIELQEQQQATTPRLPHQTAREAHEQEVSAVLGPSASVASMGGLEAQLGDLSLQYHTLLLLLGTAKGRRASQLKSQITAIELRLAALSLEIEKKKLEAAGTFTKRI